MIPFSLADLLRDLVDCAWEANLRAHRHLLWLLDGAISEKKPSNNSLDVKLWKGSKTELSKEVEKVSLSITLKAHLSSYSR